ncbi:TIGR03086 family metal-binding protein [Streptacidiphilus sp. MAP12-20]|uniref:TIGR03086 family metal-binding protein n=1 Tax=Streptacidiphilus sp. MAP12-20 TaxID=3156299 RepID=UPI00351177B5
MTPAKFDDLRRLHAQAIRESVALVRRITDADLPRPTPCTDWTLGDLLAHMTAQHRGFAAAALGRGEDLTQWAVTSLDADFVAQYDAAAEQVVAAFAQLTEPDRGLILAEFARDQSFPAALALGFHLLDYVVHGWDVARALGLGFAPDAELLAAALPVALAVPDGASRLAADSPFRPGLAADASTDTLERILFALGRSPSWPGGATEGAPSC